MKRIRFTLIVAALAVLVPALTLAAGDPAAGKKKVALCAGCHGLNGQSTQPIYPKLAGQRADYIERALQDYRDGARKNQIMSPMAAQIKESDIPDIAAWYASQKGLTEVPHI